MKSSLLTFIFCGLITASKAQSISVEKSTFGIQVGAVGVWVYNESKLTKTLALRSEFGLRCKFIDYTDGSLYLAPGITLEPRWYYNLNKRSSNEKNIVCNSANFLSIQISFIPDWFIIPIIPTHYPTLNNQISVMPTWGIRRNIGNHFNFEAGLGIGYEYIFKKNPYDFHPNTGGFRTINLHFRIGYRF